MGEIRYIIIAKQGEVAEKSSIRDGRLKKSFSSVYDLGKRFFGHPSRIDDFPCNLTQFCYNILLHSASGSSLILTVSFPYINVVVLNVW